MRYGFHCEVCTKGFEVSCPSFEPVASARCPECGTVTCIREYSFGEGYSPTNWDWDKDGLGDKLVRV